MSRDLAQLERQRAFVGLLGRPVVDRRRDMELWSLIRRHRAVLSDWFGNRLGYRLMVSDTTARLYRLPVEGAVVAPTPMRPPSRRTLVLALLAAAAAEDAEDLTTVQELSDRVRVLAMREDVDVSAYDPDRYAERQVFVRAVELLAGLGVLRRVGKGDVEQELNRWAHHEHSIGGAYEVDRELLLRLVDPACLIAALGGLAGAPNGDQQRRHTVLRRLLELPVCVYDDLTDAQRAYLTGQRHRLLHWCREMTGWTTEIRAEGIALIPPDDIGTDLAFPRIRAGDFATLLVLDQLLRLAGGTTVVDADVLVMAAAEVRHRYSKALTKELREQQGALEDTAVELLCALDLLRPLPKQSDTPPAWRLMPAAARFRNPTVSAQTGRFDQFESDVDASGGVA